GAVDLPGWGGALVVAGDEDCFGCGVSDVVTGGVPRWPGDFFGVLLPGSGVTLVPVDDVGAVGATCPGGHQSKYTSTGFAEAVPSLAPMVTGWPAGGRPRSWTHRLR